MYYYQKFYFRKSEKKASKNSDNRKEEVYLSEWLKRYMERFVYIRV
jgi:hypothetical protein